MKKLFSILAFAIFCSGLYAQDSSVTLTSRSSFSLEDGKAAFTGDYLTVDALGSIGDNFSVAVRQHLNRPVTVSDIFQATDWAFVTWTWQDRFEISAGKIVTAYGSTENDRNGWDVFVYSGNIGTMNRYRPGVNFGYRLSEKDYFQLQLTRSPYAGAPELLAVNLGWRSFRGIWEPQASTNFFQTGDKGFMHHLAMGNNFSIGDFDISADIALRSRLGSFDYFKMMSFTGEFWWKAADSLKVTGKLSLDKDYFTVGCGALYYPCRNLRAHAMFYVCNGVTYFTTGVTWALNILGNNSNIK
ncbi:MAG: OprO/OprP family phosphate-selective porin [Bacteroidales bacterium]|nr:OprO/OprP family phosphate-selective porin [Bacteroidales bacterium]